jgi:hypothetical protein
VYKAEKIKIKNKNPKRQTTKAPDAPQGALPSSNGLQNYVGAGLPVVGDHCRDCHVITRKENVARHLKVTYQVPPHSATAP